MKKTINAVKPYEGWTTYPPHFHKKEQRYYIVLKKPGEKLRCMSYARYLMATHLQRILEPWEHVDHIDNNRTNDNIDNLQILSQKENNIKSKELETYIALQCEHCEEIFLRRKGNEGSIKGYKRNFCGRQCQYKVIKPPIQQKK